MAMYTTLEAEDAKPPSSSIDRAKDVLEQATAFSNEVRLAVSRIVGSAPEPQALSGSALKEVSDGILPELASVAERTRRALSEGFEALRRLERAL